MGHEVEAAFLATLLVGGLRNARRAGVGLADRRACANDGLVANAQRGGFVTGRSGASTSAPGQRRSSTPVIRLRCGCATDASSASSSQADPPFGTVPGHKYRAQQLPLEPGDRLMFFTDGILERNTADVDIDAMVAAGAQVHPRRPCSTSSRPSSGDRRRAQRRRDRHVPRLARRTTETGRPTPAPTTDAG